jgi:hypothetical protein
MTLKLKVSTDEYKGLPEGIRGFYEEKDGSYVLGVEGVEDTSGLKSALEKERKTARELEKLAKQYQGLGKSPEEIADLLRQQEEAEKAKLEQKGEWEKLRAQLVDSHGKELSARDKVIAEKDAEIQRRQKALESYLIDAAATSAIAAEKGIPELLLPHVQRQVKVFDENGKYVVRVLTPDGTPRMNSKGEYLGVKDLIAELKSNEIYGRAFEGTGASGGGMKPGNSQQSGMFTLSRDDAKDPAKYRAAREAAAKSGATFQIAGE